MIRTLGLQLQAFDYGSFTDDVGIEWRKWLRSFETMMRASRINDEEWKKDLLLHYAGPSVQLLFDTLPEQPDVGLRGPLLNVERYVPNMTSYDEAKAKLNEFFLPKENSTYERHLLRQMHQKVGESTDAFTIRLRVQAERCGFGDRVDENIKDQIIQNCQSTALRRELLKRGDVSLEEVLSTAKIFETVAQQEKSFSNGVGTKPPVTDVNKVYAAPPSKRTRFDPSQMECHRCGFLGHLAKDDSCPARGKTCSKCFGKNHFAKKCRTKQPAKPKTNPKSERPGNGQTPTASSKIGKDEDSHTVKHIADSVDDNAEYIFNVISCDSNGEMRCEIGGVSVSAVIDSGSKYNLLSQSNWEQLKSDKVIVSNQRREAPMEFKAYGGQSLPLIGAFNAMLKVGTVSTMVEFYVVKGNGKILIGRDTATSMGVLKISAPVNEVEANQEASGHSKLGTIKDVIVDIPIRTDVTPVVQPYRRIPVALEKLVDKKIDELLNKGIIEPVNEPAKWVSPVVVVPKGDGSDVRICVDMRRANEAVERENHPLPTIEDFLPHLAKAKVFSRLDVESAFHQVG